MKGTYDCPNCGGAVPFQTSIAVFAVCPFCRSMVVRHDVNVEAIGKMAELPPDLSPLQLGARGSIDGKEFSLIGRLRVAYDEGSWNEWFAFFGNDQYGWIAEAQGFFMVSSEMPVPEDFPASKIETGTCVKIEGRLYCAADRKESTCIASEGELPFTAAPGRSVTSIDFSNDQGAFASIEYAEEGRRLFVGRYARFDDLKFTDLRAVPGWSNDELEPAHHQTTSVKCPSCGGTVELRALGQTMSAACGSCGSLIDTATPDLSLIREAQGKLRIKPQIPLGRRGVLFGVNYEVIGFQHVKDEYSGWLEYLLFNPWQGFVWLVTYNGHWSFVRRLYERPAVRDGVFENSTTVKFSGAAYRMFAVSEVRTDYVIGEFYWKVSVGMPANVTDFIAPPRILSREAYPKLGEETWSQGEYVEPEVIQAAFNITDEWPERSDEVYINQPNRYEEKFRQLKWWTPLLAAALIAVQLNSVRNAAKQEVVDGQFTYRAGVTNVTSITEPFEIPGRAQSLDFMLYAPVNNSWLEVDLDLVNADTQQAVASFNHGIEYYFGNDGEAWSEGGTTEHHLLSSVPPGRYYLTVDATADSSIQEMPFTVRAVRDVPIWSNFLIGLSLILLYPFYCGLRAWSFERQRWMDSDFSPALYSVGSGDDDDDD